MGNLCGKPSRNNFAGEGRTLGSTPANPPPIDQSSRPRAQLPSDISQQNSTKAVAAPRSISAAGKAAQERMTKASASTGKLGQQLAEQKKQTRTDTLKAASEEERALRDAQANAEARNWN